jgi:hypothetical protein
VAAVMADTRIVHVLREKFDVYIGRANARYGLPASPFANPFKIGRDGDRDQVIAQYRAWLLARPDLLARLPELRGKVLACWCKQLTSDIPCHGNVLVELTESESEMPDASDAWIADINTPRNSLAVKICTAATVLANSGAEPQILEVGDQQVALLWPDGVVPLSTTIFIVTDWGIAGRSLTMRPARVEVRHVPESDWVNVRGASAP